jgi:phage-related protein
MYGRLFLQRIGQKYVFQIGKLDSNYNFFGRWNTTFYDTANQYQSKLAGIQIHIARYGSTAVIPTMNINEIRVWDEKTLTSTEVPYVFEAGDILTIDSMTGTILKNGEPFRFQLGSSFIKLKPGTTNLAITSPVVSAGTVTYRERWLR